MDTLITHDVYRTGRGLPNVTTISPPLITKGLPSNPTAEDVISYIMTCLFSYEKQMVIDYKRLVALLRPRGIEVLRQTDKLVLTYRCKYVSTEVCLYGPTTVARSGKHGMRLQAVTYYVWLRESPNERFTLGEQGKVHLDQVKVIDLN